MWVVRVLMGDGFQVLHGALCVDSNSVHQSNTALHIQPQQRLGGGSECTQTDLQESESNECGPRRSFRFEETVGCVSASPSGGRMGLEGLSQVM